MTDTISPPGGLAAALARAIARSHAVAKDATNAHMRYQYASAEAVLEEARAALAAEGIALLPAASSVEWHSETAGVLKRTYVLMFGAEALSATQEWPVLCDRGRPQDKAAASALTTSLAYWLRDLLLLPRLGEHQMDRDPPEPRREARPAPKADPAPAPRREAPMAAPKADPAPMTLAHSSKAIAAAGYITDALPLLGIAATETHALAAYLSCDRAGRPMAGTFAKLMTLSDEMIIDAADTLAAMGESDPVATAQRWADERKAAKAEKGK